MAAVPKRKREEEESDIERRNAPSPPTAAQEPRSPQLASCWATEIHALPRSLAVFRKEFDWNGTPWLSPGVPNRLTLRIISDKAFPKWVYYETPTPSILDIGGVSNSLRLYAIFPNLNQTIGTTSDCKLLKEWTDKVMIPAFLRHLDYRWLRCLVRSHDLIVMKSQARRVEGMGSSAIDDPYQYPLLPAHLQEIWDTIVATTQRPGFEDFNGVFLAAVGYLSPGHTVSETCEEMWKKASRSWESFMDMEYVPRGDMEVHVESQMRF
ncbi:MAG: hypothetical protein Q9161_000086 [Pseudevernia consocians]